MHAWYETMVIEEKLEQSRNEVMVQLFRGSYAWRQKEKKQDFLSGNIKIILEIYLNIKAKKESGERRRNVLE